MQAGRMKKRVLSTTMESARSADHSELTMINTAVSGAGLIRKTEKRKATMTSNPPRPVIVRSIESDGKPQMGVILKAKCSIGYPPYAYVYIPYADPDYVDKLMKFLNQKCLVKESKKK